MEYAGRVPTPPTDRFIEGVCCLTVPLGESALHM
jgi:hypothetical protein